MRSNTYWARGTSKETRTSKSRYQPTISGSYLEDIDGKSSYDLALKRHKEAISDLGIPRNEITEKEDILVFISFFHLTLQRAKTYFQKTSQILNDIHTDPEVRRMRNAFALGVFLKQASHFVIFLVLVGVGNVKYLCS